LQRGHYPIANLDRTIGGFFQHFHQVIARKLSIRRRRPRRAYVPPRTSGYNGDWIIRPSACTNAGLLTSNGSQRLVNHTAVVHYNSGDRRILFYLCKDDRLRH
jgi:hypothetical protein